MFTTATPVRSGSTIDLTAHRHLSQQGFCIICGTVWPCWRGRREASSSSVL